MISLFPFSPAHLTVVLGLLLRGDGCRDPPYPPYSVELLIKHTQAGGKLQSAALLVLVLGCVACTTPKDIPSSIFP